MAQRRLARIAGIDIQFHVSWIIILALIGLTLGEYFQAANPHWAAAVAWGAAAATTVLFFAAVVLHELAHSLVARAKGLPVQAITLFVFGGVSELTREPEDAKSEFQIAIAGPLMSLALGAACLGLSRLGSPHAPVIAVLLWLGWINLALALFNLIPGFPLDGGRVLRALVWRTTGNYHRATVVAGMAGRFFGFLLIFVGIWQALTGDIGGGIWIAVIGWFLESAAASQMQQETIKTMLGGHTVASAMQRNFPHITMDISVQELVERYMMQGNAQAAVVEAPGTEPGVVTLAAIREIPHEMWPLTMASQAMTPLRNTETTRPDAILWSALEKMGHGGVNLLPVVQEGRVVGILSREDILHYLGMLQQFRGWKTISGSAR